MSEDAPAKSKPTIFVPPRTSMESLFMNGSGPGFSPGPMTLVSNLFSEQGPFSFSQLLAGAMASPMAKQGFLWSNDEVKEGAEVSESDEGKSGSESGVGYKKNRPVNLVVNQPQSQLQIQLDSLSPLFMVPPGLSPSGLLNSPGFLSPLQSPFGMSHSQALAHVTAQAALSPSFQRMQAELQRALSNEQQAPNIETSSPIENLIQPQNPLPSEPESLLLDSPEISQSDRKTTYNVGDKPASDGYNWRKYGQKQVKASECPRSYYKCTYPNCSVKKKVERSIDGRVSEITYKGNHNHDFPQPTKRGKDNSSSDRMVNNSQGIVEKKSSNEIVCVNTEPVNFFANTQQLVVKHHPDASRNDVTESPTIVLDDADNDEPAPKKRIMEAGMPSIPASTYQISESKIVVQTRSEVDLLDDGYKWRKYGQKVVKGNPHPRSYYRCTFAGCNVRKHVERASADPKAVITTYEGKHDHDIPAGRYSSHGNAIANAQQSKQQKSAKNRFVKEMVFANHEQIPMTLQLKEEQLVV